MTHRRFGGRARRLRSWLVPMMIVLALLPRGTAASHLGVVYGTEGAGVWLKGAPALDAPRIMALPEGTAVQLLEGPTRAGDERYWARVATADATGWMVAEYLLLENHPPPANTTPPGVPVPGPAAGAAPLPAGGWAQVIGTYPAEGLRLRAAPAPWETLLAILPEGSTLQVVDGPTTGGNGDPWYRVAANGKGGWVDGTYLAPAPEPVSAAGVLAAGGWAQVTGTYPAEGLRLRAAPAPWERLLAVIPEGSKLRIVAGPTTGGNGDPWYRVTADGTSGWVSGLYLVPTRAPSGDPPAPPGTPGGNALAKEALALVGKPYAWGGVGPDAFDCSGLVLFLAQRTLGITVPRIAADQAFAGVHVDLDKLAPGDLVFYANTYQPGISHVGIYIGANRWVTAQDELSGVVMLTLDVPYWKARYAGARRIV